jgi:hypothetical protein
MIQLRSRCRFYIDITALAGIYYPECWLSASSDFEGREYCAKKRTRGRERTFEYRRDTRIPLWHILCNRYLGAMR